MCMYGYVRVSSKHQNISRQLDALIKYGISEDCIFVDKFSGKDFQRPNYIKLKKKIKEGDVLVITSIDRLGRNYSEILEEWRNLVKYMGVDIVVIDMPILNTTDKKDLLKTFICDVVLQVLSFVAENEREDIKKRQAEGIEAAKARGVKFGRPPKKRGTLFEHLKEKWENGNISSREAAKLLKVDHTTFIRWVKNN